MDKQAYLFSLWLLWQQSISSFNCSPQRLREKKKEGGDFDQGIFNIYCAIASLIEMVVTYCTEPTDPQSSTRRILQHLTHFRDFVLESTLTTAKMCAYTDTGLKKKRKKSSFDSGRALVDGQHPR